MSPNTGGIREERGKTVACLGAILLPAKKKTIVCSYLVLLVHDAPTLGKFSVGTCRLRERRLFRREDHKLYVVLPGMAQ